ncbi:MAG: hypothetical protein KA785_01180 [Spirochaetaceae bacterium]|nr:hypothetical protein [Spirochaetaceae bacterium]
MVSGFFQEAGRGGTRIRAAYVISLWVVGLGWWVRGWSGLLQYADF